MGIAEDIFEFEREARDRALELVDRGKLGASFVAFYYPLDAALEREGRRLRACLYAAKDATTFVALVKGQPVPPDRITDKVRWARRKLSR